MDSLRTPYPNVRGFESLSKRVEQDQQILVLFINDWSLPCRQAARRIQKFNIRTDKVVVVNTEDSENYEIVDQYQIKVVPYGLLFEAGKKTDYFSGFVILKMNQVLERLKETVQPKEDVLVTQACPNGHNLEQKSKLPEYYASGLFQCNSCKRIEKVDQNHQVGHCGDCDYDICWICTSNSSVSSVFASFGGQSLPPT